MKHFNYEAEVQALNAAYGLESYATEWDIEDMSRREEYAKELHKLSKKEDKRCKMHQNIEKMCSMIPWAILLLGTGAFVYGIYAEELIIAATGAISVAADALYASLHS